MLIKRFGTTSFLYVIGVATSQRGLFINNQGSFLARRQMSLRDIKSNLKKRREDPGEDLYTEPGSPARTRRRSQQFFAFPPFSPPASHVNIKRKVFVAIMEG